MINPYAQVKSTNWDTYYTGWGSKTHPKYGTYNINRRWLAFHARFYTQMDGYDASYAIGRKDSDGPSSSDQLTNEPREHEFAKDLLGFDTNNEGDKQIPTMQIFLAGYRDWEQILTVDDYVALQVEEQYPDDPHWQEMTKSDPYSYNGIERRTLMTGLISDVNTKADATQNGHLYIITCQGMQKILNNIHVGLPRTAQLASTNLFFDIKGASNPANETFQFGASASTPSSPSSGSSSNSSGGGSFGLSGVAGQLASALSSHGFDKAQIAGILGIVGQESTFQANASNGSHFGFFQCTDSSVLGKSPQYQVNYICTNGDWAARVKQFKSGTSGSSDPDKCSIAWGADFEKGGENSEGIHPTNGQPGASQWYSKMH